MKKIAIFSVIYLIVGCAHYSTVGTDNVIDAPSEIVWENTLQALKDENILLTSQDRESLHIKAQKQLTALSWGDLMEIQLVPQGPQKTILNIESRAGAQLIGWGQQERVVKKLFQNIKTMSED
jgi:hypothetical protein